MLLSFSRPSSTSLQKLEARPPKCKGKKCVTSHFERTTSRSQILISKYLFSPFVLQQSTSHKATQHHNHHSLANAVHFLHHNVELNKKKFKFNNANYQKEFGPRRLSLHLLSSGRIARFVSFASFRSVRFGTLLLDMSREVESSRLCPDCNQRPPFVNDYREAICSL